MSTLPAVNHLHLQCIWNCTMHVVFDWFMHSGFVWSEKQLDVPEEGFETSAQDNSVFAHVLPCTSLLVDCVSLDYGIVVSGKPTHENAINDILDAKNNESGGKSDGGGCGYCHTRLRMRLLTPQLSSRTSFNGPQWHERRGTAYGHMESCYNFVIYVQTPMEQSTIDQFFPK